MSSLVLSWRTRLHCQEDPPTPLDQNHLCPACARAASRPRSVEEYAQALDTDGWHFCMRLNSINRFLMEASAIEGVVERADENLDLFPKADIAAGRQPFYTAHEWNRMSNPYNTTAVAVGQVAGRCQVHREFVHS